MGFRCFASDSVAVVNQRSANGADGSATSSPPSTDVHTRTPGGLVKVREEDGRREQVQHALRKAMEAGDIKTIQEQLDSAMKLNSAEALGGEGWDATLLWAARLLMTQLRQHADKDSDQDTAAPLELPAKPVSAPDSSPQPLSSSGSPSKTKLESGCTTTELLQLTAEPQEPELSVRETSNMFRQSVYAATQRLAYEDPDFPAENRSLFLNENSDGGDDAFKAVFAGATKASKMQPSKTMKKFKKKGWGNGTNIVKLAQSSGPIPWVKGPEALGPNCCLFDKGVLPHDFQQGTLGNCWFLSAISALAERPYRIIRLFKERALTQNGKYHIMLCKDGMWQQVTVDDRLPATSEGKPLYMRSKQRKLWGPLLEKAAAKAHGHYHALKAGYAFEAWMDLTGAPFDYIKMAYEKDKDQLIRRLRGYFLNGYMLAASCTHDGDRNELGLASGHAYSISKIVAFDGHRLLQMRNPWGYFEWKGDWSDFSDRWTVEAREELGYIPGGDDGFFWMSYEDFCKYFSRLFVSKEKEDWHVTRVPFQLSLAPANPTLVAVYSLTVEEDEDDAPAPRLPPTSLEDSHVPGDSNVPGDEGQERTRRPSLHLEDLQDDAAGRGLHSLIGQVGDVRMREIVHAYIGIRQRDERSEQSAPYLAAGIDVVPLDRMRPQKAPMRGLARGHEDYQVRGVCTTSRQNQIEAVFESGKEYLILVYAGHSTDSKSAAHLVRDLTLSCHASQAVTIEEYTLPDWRHRYQLALQELCMKNGSVKEVLLDLQPEPEAHAENSSEILRLSGGSPEKANGEAAEAGALGDDHRVPQVVLVEHTLRCRSIWCVDNRTDKECEVTLDFSGSAECSSLLTQLEEEEENLGNRMVTIVRVPPRSSRLANVVIKNKVWTTFQCKPTSRWID